MDRGLDMESMESSLRRRLLETSSGPSFRRVPGPAGVFDELNNEEDASSVTSSTSPDGGFRVSSLFSPSWYLSVIWNSIHSATFASVFVILLIWASIFIYITFYFLYIPSLDLSRAIHFQFDSDCYFNENNKCSPPHADIALGQYRTPTLFAKGQQYKIRIDLNLPESHVNRDQGMFMIRLSLRDMNNKNIVTSSRGTMLTYKSLPVKLLHTLFSWPLLLTGFRRESEEVRVPLIEEYIDGTRPAHGPASSARVELISRDLQVYSSTLVIQAHLTGLRYYMVNWPILTAMFGIATIFAFLSLITICSINRVVRDDSADTEIIFSDDLISNPDSGTSTTGTAADVDGEGNPGQPHLQVASKHESPDQADDDSGDDDHDHNLSHPDSTS